MIFVVVFSVFNTSCVLRKKVIYFSDIPDTLSAPIVANNVAVYHEPVIECNDILAITVQTIEQNSTNQPISSNSIGTYNALNGFLVDKNGYIELSLIGFVKVGGLTTTEAREIIKQKAREFYKEPVVNVKISNFDILVLGDVNKAGSFSFPNEKVTILDAIAASGDISLTGLRNKVLLIRTINNEKTFVRLNLTSSSVFSSPYFYLKQRDVIFIEQNRVKLQASDQRLVQYLGLTSTVLSLITLIIAFRHF